MTLKGDRMLKISSFDWIQKDINEIDRLCNNNNTQIFIYGAGVYGRILATFFAERGLRVPIKYVVDDIFFSEQQCAQGTICFSDYLKNHSHTAPLVFGIYDYGLVLKKKEQFAAVIDHMYDFHLAVVNGEYVDWSRDYFDTHEEEFKKTYDLLFDERSKGTMQAYLNAAIMGEFDELYAGYLDTPPYFNGILRGRNIKQLFDCGAYDGDSAHDYISAFPDYDVIYEFEPDKGNVFKIMNRVEREKIRDLKIINKGVWSESTTLHFKSEGKSSSSVSDEGDVSIDVIRLDDIYEDFTKNSLIKMDIEGSELEALKGAERVIREIAPSLAICVYHKREDLITIPQYIDSIAPTGAYEYRIGYQGTDLAELVFYALPTRI